MHAYTRRISTSRLVHAAVIGSLAAVFSTYGLVAIYQGGLVLGCGFVGIGAITMLTAAVVACRGGWIGVKIVGTDVIVRHYFSERRIQISRIQRVYRSVDATALETTDGQVVIDDTYFGDPSARNAFFDALSSRTSPVGATQANDRQKPKWIRAKRPLLYLGLALQGFGGCVFVAYGILSITQARTAAGIFFVVMGAAFLIMVKFEPH
jgi:hypothetical protein